MSNYLTAVDPGAGSWYSATFEDGALIRVDAVHAPQNGPHGTWEATYASAMFRYPVVIEFPRIYRLTPNPEDILNLACMVGGIIGNSPHFKRVYRPSEWKGTVKKEEMTKRILTYLEKDELDIVMNYTIQNYKRHNIIDAVGIGLYDLGRMPRGGVKKP